MGNRLVGLDLSALPGNLLLLKGVDMAKGPSIEYTGDNAHAVVRWIRAANGDIMGAGLDGEELCVIGDPEGVVMLAPGETLVAYGEGMFYAQPVAVSA